MVPVKTLPIPNIVNFFGPVRRLGRQVPSTARSPARERTSEAPGNHRMPARLPSLGASLCSILAVSAMGGRTHMKTLLGLAAVVAACLLLASPADAQGSCSGLCARASAECQRRVGDLGAACQRRFGGVARYAAECQRRERTYSGACTARYRQCVRACGGR